MEAGLVRQHEQHVGFYISQTCALAYSRYPCILNLEVCFVKRERRSMQLLINICYVNIDLRMLVVIS